MWDAKFELQFEFELQSLILDRKLFFFRFAEESRFMFNTSWIFVVLFLQVVTDLHPIIRTLFEFGKWKQLSIELSFAMCVLIFMYLV